MPLSSSMLCFSIGTESELFIQRAEDFPLIFLIIKKTEKDSASSLLIQRVEDFPHILDKKTEKDSASSLPEGHIARSSNRGCIFFFGKIVHIWTRKESAAKAPPRGQSTRKKMGHEGQWIQNKSLKSCSNYRP